MSPQCTVVSVVLVSLLSLTPTWCKPVKFNDEETGLKEFDRLQIAKSEFSDGITSSDDTEQSKEESYLFSSKNGNFFEGDLALSKDIIKTFYGKDASISTTGISGQRFRWPNGNIVYELDSGLHKDAVSIIHKAMKSWSSVTCLTFTPRNGEENYVKIQSTDSYCYSDAVGYLGSGKQTINLEYPGCISKIGIPEHELGHIIGLWHEQSRPDRDLYVKIKEMNIEPIMMHNFQKRFFWEVDTTGLMYDYGSVMHYDRKAFSINGEDTIKVVNELVYAEEGRPELGQRHGLSKKDIEVINRLYGCSQGN